jgi:hypothetical protein
VTLDRDELQRLRPGAGPGDQATRALVQSAVDEVNGRLASFEQIRRFAVLEHDFTEATGELTPTMKVRRNLIADRYRDTIERLYHGGEEGDGGRPRREHDGGTAARPYAGGRPGSAGS